MGKLPDFTALQRQGIQGNKILVDLIRIFTWVSHQGICRICKLFTWALLSIILIPYYFMQSSTGILLWSSVICLAVKFNCAERPLTSIVFRFSSTLCSWHLSDLLQHSFTRLALSKLPQVYSYSCGRLLYNLSTSAKLWSMKISQEASVSRQPQDITGNVVDSSNPCHNRKHLSMGIPAGCILVRFC